MCVIILAEDARPTDIMMDGAWVPNDDGAGIAWREPTKETKGLPADQQVVEVVFRKGLDLAQIKELAHKVPLPFVLHFRSASQGGVWPELTHPFEVHEDAVPRLGGRTRNPVLFHNGTWGAWQEKCQEAAIRSGVGVPLGLWSDSRALAWMSSEALCGKGFTALVPGQKGVIFAPDWYNVFRGPDGWVPVTDAGNTFWCSNDRPWKNVATQQQSRGNHGYNSNMCRYSGCKRKDTLGGTGYCADHPGGREIGKEALAIVAPHGGGADKSPFQNQTPHRLVTLEEVKELEKKGEISSNLVRNIENLVERMTNPQLQPSLQKKAEEDLWLVTRSLTGSGRLVLTPPAQ